MQGWIFRTSRLWATYRLDIKILPGCMSPGHSRKCDNKIEVFKLLLSFIWPSPLKLRERWMSGSFTKYIRPHTLNTLMQICPGLYKDMHIYTHTFIYTYLSSPRNHTHVPTPSHMSSVICVMNWDDVGTSECIAHIKYSFEILWDYS